MELILWRHAHAEDGLPDAKRALTSKGRRQAETMARWIEPRLPRGTRVLASPALRTRQTADALGLPYETDEAVGTAADAPGLLAAAGWPSRGACVLVVGHQPTLGRTAALLLSGRELDWSIRKGAIWWFESRNGDALLRAALGEDLAE